MAVIARSRYGLSIKVVSFRGVTGYLGCKAGYDAACSGYSNSRKCHRVGYFNTRSFLESAYGKDVLDLKDLYLGASAWVWTHSCIKASLVTQRSQVDNGDQMCIMILCPMLVPES